MNNIQWKERKNNKLKSLKVAKLKDESSSVNVDGGSKGLTDRP